MAFDFTHIFEDETLAPAVISYITHRIDETTSSIGAPGLIMIDETRRCSNTRCLGIAL
jgi:type IV secretory pathway VirB4 component